MNQNPADLEECFLVLNEFICQEQIVRFIKCKEEDLTGSHYSLGIWIRNNWGLRTNSHLTQFFKDRGVNNPNDMSTIILKSYHRWLNRRKIKLKKQIEELQESR